MKTDSKETVKYVNCFENDRILTRALKFLLLSNCCDQTFRVHTAGIQLDAAFEVVRLLLYVCQGELHLKVIRKKFCQPSGQLH